MRKVFLLRFYIFVSFVFVTPLFSQSVPLVINEVMTNPNPDSQNPYGFFDFQLGRTVVSDWIEIYNKSDQPISLAGYYLSDDCMNPTKWRIPEEAQLVVPAHGTVVIWAAGYYRGVSNCAPNPNEGYIPCPNPIPPTVAPFRLSARGEWIGLYDKDGATLIDGFEIPPLPYDRTYGCYPDGDTQNRGFLLAPTVGEVIEGDKPAARGEQNLARAQVGPIVNVRSYRGIRTVDGREELTVKVEPGQAIRIVAEVYDPDDPDPLDEDNRIKEVLLHWKPTREGRERTTPMQLRANDPSRTVYEARIGPLNPQSPEDPESVVAFYVSAEDKEGNVTEAYADPSRKSWFKILIGQRGNFSSDVVINEVLAANAGCPDYEEGEVQDPTAPPCVVGGADTGKTASRQEAEDWIEIYNRGDEPVSVDVLQDLYITNDELRPTLLRLSDLLGHSPSVDSGGLLGHAHALIWCDNEPYENDEVGLHAPFQLNAKEDEVFLFAYRDSNDDGDPEVFVLLDVISWGPAQGRRYGPSRGPQDRDWSLGRFPDGEDSWGRMEPTPGESAPYTGAPNTGFKPYLNLVSYWPVLVKVGDKITFKVKAWGDIPLSEVTLHWDIYGSMREVALQDDGVAPDEVKGDGIYAAEVEVEREGSLYYYLSARDEEGNSATFPAGSSGRLRIFVGPTAEDLLISEVMAANRRCPCGEREVPGCELGGVDANGDADDWVEIYNPTGRQINLFSYYLSDRLDWLTRWRFPSITIGPGERAIVWCDGELGEQAEVPSLTELHSSFNLNADNEDVALVKDPTKRQIISYVKFRDLPSDVSYGLDPEGKGYGVLMYPTPSEENAPLAANADAILEVGEDPNSPRPLQPGMTITVLGRALERTQHVFVIPRREDDSAWSWEDSKEATFSLSGENLKVTLPGTLSEGRYLLCVLSGYGESWNEGGVPFTRLEFVIGEAEENFRRGDVNADGTLNIADAISLLTYLFGGGEDPGCMDAADANDDGGSDVADAISILSYLFAGGKLAEPIECGPDPTPDELPACNYPACP